MEGPSAAILALNYEFTVLTEWISDNKFGSIVCFDWSFHFFSMLQNAEGFVVVKNRLYHFSVELLASILVRPIAPRSWMKYRDWAYSKSDILVPKVLVEGCSNASLCLFIAPQTMLDLLHVKVCKERIETSKVKSISKKPVSTYEAKV